MEFETDVLVRRAVAAIKRMEQDRGPEDSRQCRADSTSTKGGIVTARP